jgi:endoglucanase
MRVARGFRSAARAAAGPAESKNIMRDKYTRPRRLTAALLAVLAASAFAGASGPLAAAPAVDQLGYLPGGAKWAVVAGGDVAASRADSFTVVDAITGRAVFQGPLLAPARWAPAREDARLADFSALQAPGRYRVHVDGGADSAAFVIAPDAYRALAVAALKAYYFNRASLALAPEFAGPWARAAGHPDTQVRVHPSAAGPHRAAGDVIASPGGWYDAGDYNKYVVNAGISVYTLLAAYEQFPAFFRELPTHIPETGNGLPDVVNESLWELQWLLTMQDPDDGGVYHKLTDGQFDGVEMPAQASGTRYVVQKSTAATLDFAAVMAQASRVMRAFESQRPGLSDRMLAASRKAWDWAQAHPWVVYQEPADIHTGHYGDDHLDDEFAWAAAELYVATKDDRYYAAMHADRLAATVPNWGDVAGLAWMTLAQHRQELTAAADTALIARRVGDLAEALARRWASSPFRTSMVEDDFKWGSNSIVLNQALMLVQGYRLGGPRRELDAAQAALDQVLGRNALGRSMVTGFGTAPPLHPHHRPSQADDVAAPVPGFLVGGPNPGRQDAAGCRDATYASDAPAASYLDAFCSYASNEVAINWNAPLVYVAAALQSLTPPATRP